MFQVMTRLSRILTVLLLFSAFACDISSQQPSKPFTVVIDAGHGGKDPGAVNGRNQEKTINLNVALRVGALLQQNCPDVKVIYTRKTDVFVELYKRADIANKADADIFVSIHTNAAKSSAAQGAETYLLGVEENRTSANLSVAIEENRAILYESDYETHYEGYDPQSTESQIIFEFMQNEYQKESLEMASLVQKQLVSTAHRSDHGVHQAGYLVLWKSAMPSILIELGYISNPTEMKYLVSAKGIEELSKGIYQALDKYITDRRALQTQTSAKPVTAVNTDQADDNGVICFKVQVLTSDTKLSTGSTRLKGLKDVDFYRDGKLYKYTSGSTQNYDEARKMLSEIRKTHKDAFIIAMRNGVRMDLQEAIKAVGK